MSLANSFLAVWLWDGGENYGSRWGELRIKRKLFSSSWESRGSLASGWMQILWQGDAEFSGKRRGHGPHQGRWKDCYRGKEGTGEEGTDSVRVCWLIAGTEGIPIWTFLWSRRKSNLLRKKRRVGSSKKKLRIGKDHCKKCNCQAAWEGHSCWSHEDTAHVLCPAVWLSPAVPAFRHSVQKADNGVPPRPARGY